MKVSLVATVKDVGPPIHEFLASVAAQTRRPDEVVVTDGGSSDGTLEALRRAEGITAIETPGANIARGRNLAVRAATHDVIAVTDGDCVLATDWLERLLDPLERGADVSAGMYLPLDGTFFQTCAAAVSVRDLDEIGPGWMPSSRSIAFRREVFEAAGGYPEWLDIGEDMFLNHRLVQVGARIEPAFEALVSWRIRPTLAGTWRQYAQYAEGDALAGMYPRRHLLRFTAYGAAVAALVSRRVGLVVPVALAGTAYASRPIRRGWRRLGSRPWHRPAGTVVVPALMLFTDAAKMWGYARGLVARARGRTRAPRSPGSVD